MIKKYMPAHWKYFDIYMVVFDQGDNHGHMFPCDKDGNLGTMTAKKKAEYDRCMAHPEWYSRFDQIVNFKVPYEVEEKGVCECGYTVFLRDAGMFGTCECPKCKRRYDIHGREHKGKRVCA